MKTAFRHMHQISVATTPGALWAHLIEATAGYGFDRLQYGYTRSMRSDSPGDMQDVLYLTNMGNDDPASNSAAMDLMRRTPMFSWLMTNVGACSWRWSEEQRAAGALSPDQIFAMDTTRKMGLQAGYSISFAEPSPRARGAMSLIASHGRTQANVDAVWAESGDEILAICNMFHLRMAQMPLRGGRRPLSPRQREALEWVAEGKTTQDIAVIMGVSPAMVEKHLRLARVALDVETTAHAVAKAALLNCIFTSVTEVDPPRMPPPG